VGLKLSAKDMYICDNPKLLHHSLVTCIHDSTIKTNTIHNVLYTTHVSLLFLLHVSARLGQYESEQVELKEVI